MFIKIKSDDEVKGLDIILEDNSADLIIYHKNNVSCRKNELCVGKMVDVFRF